MPKLKKWPHRFVKLTMGNILKPNSDQSDFTQKTSLSWNMIHNTNIGKNEKIDFLDRNACFIKFLFLDILLN